MLEKIQGGFPLPAKVLGKEETGIHIKMHYRSCKTETSAQANFESKHQPALTFL